MKIAIKDNIIAEVARGTTVEKVAESISAGLAKTIVCGKINGKLVDLKDKIGRNCKLELISTKDEDARLLLNDSASHILAQAVKSIYPSAKLVSGYGDSEGFYYDFEFKTAIKDDDLATIEEEMCQIANANFEIKSCKISIDEAVNRMALAEESFKIERLEKYRGDELRVYKQGEFVDLCDNPHIASTSLLKYFKLSTIEDVFYKDNIDLAKFTRIKGFAYFKASDLVNRIKRDKEIKKRDHVRLGKTLELFMFSDTSKGSPYWFPNGWRLYNSLLNYCREVNSQYGYAEVSSPVLSDNQLCVDSGHYSYCTNDIFELKQKNLDCEYILKTANCPSSMVLYNAKTRDEKDFPLRFLEFGLLHRKLDESKLNGLFNVRSFRQDDAHNFVLPKDLESEFIHLFELTDKIYKTFGLKYNVELSTKPKNFVGDNSVWAYAENILRSILDKKFGEGNYKINEGEGSFFGPRIDIVVKDALLRTWKTGAFQLDMQLPDRFGLSYTTSNNKKKVPILVHRTILGSIERFIAILTEHFEGKFPFWLAPIQTIIVTKLDSEDVIIKKLKMALQSIGISCKIVNGTFGEKLNKELFKETKVPYILSVDSTIVKKHKVMVEVRGEKQVIFEATIKDFLEKLNKQNKSRALNLIKEF